MSGDSELSIRLLGIYCAQNISQVEKFFSEETSIENATAQRQLTVAQKQGPELTWI